MSVCDRVCTYNKGVMCIGITIHIHFWIPLHTHIHMYILVTGECHNCVTSFLNLHCHWNSPRNVSSCNWKSSLTETHQPSSNQAHTPRPPHSMDLLASLGAAVEPIAVSTGHRGTSISSEAGAGKRTGSSSSQGGAQNTANNGTEGGGEASSMLEAEAAAIATLAVGAAGPVRTRGERPPNEFLMQRAVDTSNVSAAEATAVVALSQNGRNLARKRVRELDFGRNSPGGVSVFEPVYPTKRQPDDDDQDDQLSPSSYEDDGAEHIMPETDYSDDADSSSSRSLVSIESATKVCMCYVHTSIHVYIYALARTHAYIHIYIYLSIYSHTLVRNIIFWLSWNASS